MALRNGADDSLGEDIGGGHLVSGAGAYGELGSQLVGGDEPTGLGEGGIGTQRFPPKDTNAPLAAKPAFAGQHPSSGPDNWSGKSDDVVLGGPNQHHGAGRDDLSTEDYQAT